MDGRVKSLRELLLAKKRRSLEAQVRACGEFVASLGPEPPLVGECLTVEECGAFAEAAADFSRRQSASRG